MKTIVSGRNMDVTGALRDTVQSKLGKLDRFFHKELKHRLQCRLKKTDIL